MTFFRLGARSPMDGIGRVLFWALLLVCFYPTFANAADQRTTSSGWKAFRFCLFRRSRKGSTRDTFAMRWIR